MDMTEEIPAEKIALDPRGAEADLEIEGAKVCMFEANTMKHAHDAASAGRLVLLLFANEEVEADGPTDAAVEKRTLGTRVEVGVHIDGLIWIYGIREAEGQPRESLSIEVVRIGELVVVAYGEQVLQAQADDVGCVDLHEENVRDTDTPRSGLGDEGSGIWAMGDQLVTVQHDPLTRVGTKQFLMLAPPC